MGLWIDTAQNSWFRIMNNSNGIDLGEVIVIAGEHNDYNRDYLLNLWGFALARSLYISYDRSKATLLDCWRASRLCPVESEIGSIRYIETDGAFDINSIARFVKKIKPTFLFIENTDFSNGFEEKIQILKKFAKSENIAIFVQINPEFIDEDTVLNSKALNKIYYLTSKSAYVYKKGVDNPQRIAIAHNAEHYTIYEDDKNELDPQEMAVLIKTLKRKRNFYDSHCGKTLILDEEKPNQKEQKEEAHSKEKEKTGSMKMTFGQ